MTLQTFTASTLEAPAVFSLSLLDVPAGAPTQTQGNVVRRLKIFRTGTHTDSRGRVNTWTQDDLEKMAEHFRTLRGAQVTTDEGISFNGALPWVPVRADHTQVIKDVVGWFSNVYTDPSAPGFLFGDVEFTEPDAHAKYQRGTFRNRSIEVGRYTDNDGNVFEPTVLGLAFVDLPAVEGLFRAAQQGAPLGDKSPSGHAHSQGDHVEKTPELIAAEAALAAAEAALAAEKTAKAALETEHAALLAASNAAQAELVTLRTGNAGPATFSIAGAQTQDFAAVQAHILTLETFRTETITNGRTNFVEELASHGKIANPQKDSFVKLALGMDNEQFELFKAGFEAQPVLQQFGRLPLTNGQPPVAGGGGDPVAEEISVCKDILASHRAGGMREEDVAKTASFRRLAELTKNA